MAGQRLGQHFLASQKALRRIAEAACPQREPLVIEIGAGKGALTALLVERADRVVAIELDGALATSLPARVPARNLTVVEQDVLAADLGQWGQAVIAGNLPYYITSPIVERILDLRALCTRAVLLVQKEVALRLTADAGTRDYGYLSVRTQLFADARLLCHVPAGAFQPPPKVDSAVVVLEPHAAPVSDTQAFVAFLSVCFRQKRKTLRNNLAPVYGAAVAGLAEQGLRAEQLSLDRLIELFQRVIRLALSGPSNS